MNANIANTIEAVTTGMNRTYVEEVKDLGDYLGVRHTGDAIGRRWIVNAAEENGMRLANEDEDSNQLVFA